MPLPPVRRQSSFVLLSLLLVTSLTVVAGSCFIFGVDSAEATGETEGNCGNGLTWTFDTVTGNLTITGNGAIEDYNYSDERWGSNEIKSVSFTGNISRIGQNAFANCKSLMTFVIPESVEQIGSYAFSGCERLTSITIGSSVQSIDRSAFSGCNRLFEVINLSSLDVHDYSSVNTAVNIFSERNESTVITTPTGFVVGRSSDSWYLLDYDGNNTEVVLPDRINGNEYVVWNYAFSNTDVESVTISEGVTAIGKNAFSGCVSLENILISNTVARIGDYAFSSCDSLTDIQLPSSLEIIGTFTFSDCRSLNSLEIPDSVKHINDNAFYRCSSLVSITIPSSVENISRSAFSYCTNLSSIDVDADSNHYCSIDGILYNNSQTILVHYPANCSISELFVSERVESINEYVFQNCHNLRSINVSDDNEKYSSHNGVLFDKEGHTLIRYPSAKTEQSYVISDNVWTIARYAFADCSNLNSIVIGKMVTSVGSDAFKGDYFDNIDNKSTLVTPWSNTSPSPTVTYVSFDSAHLSISGDVKKGEVRMTETADGFSFRYNLDYGVATLVKCNGAGTSADFNNTIINGKEYDLIIIANEAFRNCKTIRQVTLDDSLLLIGDNAFNGCSSLTNISIPDSVINIGECAFSNCTSLEHTILSESLTSIKNRTFSNCSSLDAITVPDSVMYIEESAFSNCTSLRQTILNESLISIGDNAFYGCSSLADITIPDSVINIGGSAFSNCTSLKHVILSESLTSIGDNAFYGCSSLSDIIIPDSVINIGEYAFSGCISLKQTEIGNSIETIKDGAFERCSSLINIVLPNSLCSIGRASFMGCSNLNTITIGRNLASVDPYSFYDCPKLESFSVDETNESFKSVDGVIYSKDGRTLIQFPPGRQGSYEISSGVTNIGITAFWKTAITDIIIPDTVENIGEYAFYDCSNLKSIEVSPSSTHYAIVNGALIDLSNFTVIKYPEARTDTVWSVPSNVSVIGTYAFANSKNLKTIELPNGLKTIEPYAFSNCDNLTYVTLPNGLTVLDDSAFTNCRSLIEIIIPSTVKTIGDYSFSNCSMLNSVIIENGTTKIGSYAFSKCGLFHITIPHSIETIEDNAFRDCVKLFEVVNLSLINVERGSTDNGLIGYYAINVVTSLTDTTVETTGEGFVFGESEGEVYLLGYVGQNNDISLPRNYKGSQYNVRSYAFLWCKGLKSIIISEGVKSLGAYSLPVGSYSLPVINSSESIPAVLTPMSNTNQYNSSTSPDDYVPHYLNTYFGYQEITIDPGMVITIDPVMWELPNMNTIERIDFSDSIQSIDEAAFGNCTFYDTNGTSQITVNANNLRDSIVLIESSKDLTYFSYLSTKAVIQITHTITFKFGDEIIAKAHYIDGDTSVAIPDIKSLNDKAYWPDFILDGTDLVIQAQIESDNEDNLKNYLGIGAGILGMVAIAGAVLVLLRRR